MVASYKLHKLSGLTAGVILFILAVSGFVLDHDYWKPFYTIRFHTDSKKLLQKERRLITSKLVLKDHIIVGSMRGIYEKKEGKFVQTLALPVMALALHRHDVYAATSKGIYIKKGEKWHLFALAGKVVTDISTGEAKLIAVVDKSELAVLDYSGNILEQTQIRIQKKELEQNITLSRFLRDLHYGRGIFDGGFSLLLNDYAAFVLAFLALSGYIIRYLIFQKKAGKKARFLIKLHANGVTLFATIFMMILAVTGIYLDHASFFGKYSKNIHIPHNALPPVYSTLKEDIWSVALYNNHYYIGNRVGVYASNDMHNWELVSPGFGYSLSKVEDNLYIGGMGAPNRVCDTQKCTILPNTPHMFKQAYKDKTTLHYLTSHDINGTFPRFDDISLYTLMLTLHDGSFFASWWKWINDAAAVLLFVLISTGGYRWWRKRAAKAQTG